MLVTIKSLLTFEQSVLNALIIGCGLVLVLSRPAAGKHHCGPTGVGRAAVRAGRVVLAVILIAVTGLLLQRGDDPIGVRADSWSEAYLLTAGQNYARQGLWKDYGVAQHQVITDQNPPDPYHLYNGFPVGHNLINGLWQIAGVESPRVYRLPPIACSLAALLLWFGLYARIAGHTVAVVAVAAMALSYGFLAYADHLYYHAYAMCSSAAAMCCYVRAMQPVQPRRLRWFLLTALFMFLTACFTWEYHLWMVLFIALYAVFFPSPVRRPYLALLAVPLFVGLALQIAQRHLALADVTAASSEPPGLDSGFLGDLYRRTLGFEDAVDTPPGVSLSTYPLALIRRYYNFHGLPVLSVLAMLVMLLMHDQRAPWKVREWPNGERLLVVLLCAQMGWWLVFLQHTAVHAHVMRLGLTGYALLMALVWQRCWQTARSAAFPSLARGAAVVLAVVLCYPQLEGLVTNLRVHLEDRYQDGRERGTAGVGEARKMSRLQSCIPAGAVILTNHNRLPPMRLWSQRPVYSGTLPGYPLGDSENSRMIIEMRFNHLRELYDDDLPPLYYVYIFCRGDPKSVFDNDALLRFLLLGRTRGGEHAWLRARSIINEGLRTARSAASFCPIVGEASPILVFDLQPAIPYFRELWGGQPYPTLRQYGPAR